jgi:NB-ARC domain/TIR domain
VSGRGGCFLSYGRKDDEEFVRRLHARLVAGGIDVWWDREAMRSRGVTFLTEIDDAIRAAGHVVLVSGPEALASDYVAHELAVAEENCTIVVPVLRLGRFDDLPEALRLRHVFDLRTENEREFGQLLATLTEPPAPPGPLIGEIRAPPARMINRDAALNSIVSALMDDVRDPVVVAGGTSPTAIVGMSGIGKTVLAALVARSCEVRRRFADGVVFLHVGPERSPHAETQQLRRALGDAPDAGDSEAEAASALHRLLAASRNLVILDDVWTTDQLTPVVAATYATSSRVLATSRQVAVAAGVTTRVEIVDLPTQEAALALLEQWIGHAAPDETRSIIDRCGRLPLALDICGALLHRGTSVDDLLAALEAAELEVLDLELPGYEHRGVFAAVEASLRWLHVRNPMLEARYRLLAAFDAAEPVPLSVVYRLWEAESDAARRTARRQLDELAAASLIYRAQGKTIGLHDIHRAYLIAAGADVGALRSGLLDVYAAEPGGWVEAAGSEPWLRRNLFGHLTSLGRIDEAAALLARETPEGGNAWYELRSAAGELDGYWADLDAVEARLDGVESATAVRVGTRLVTIRSSIRALVSNTPGPLVIAAVDAGVWPLQRAIALVDRMDDPRDRTAAMIDLLPSVADGDEWIRQLFEVLVTAELDWTDLLSALERRVEPEQRATAAHAALAALERLGPELTHVHVLAVSPFLSRGDLTSARAIAGRIADDRLRPVALAALTPLVDDAIALATVEQLLGQVSDYVARAEIVRAASRTREARMGPLLETVWSEIFGGLQLREPGATVAAQRLLPMLRPEDAAVIATDDELRGAMFAYTSTFETLKLLGACAANRDVAPLSIAMGREATPAIYGTAILAAVLARSPDAANDRLRAEVVTRLEASLEEMESTDDWSALGDVAPYLGPILSQLPESVRAGLVAGPAKIGSTRTAAQAAAGFAPGLRPDELAAELERQLARLRGVSSSLDLRRPLATIAPFLTPLQVQTALEIAAASRDDGSEKSWLATLVQYLDDDARQRSHLWILERTAEHLGASDVFGSAHAKESDLARLAIDFVRLGASEITLERLRELARTLQLPPYRARCLAALASVRTGRDATTLWTEAETLADTVADDGDRAELLGVLASLADGERRSRYAAAALALEATLDNDHWRADTLEALPDSSEVTTRIVLRLREARDFDVYGRGLAGRVPPSTLAEIYDERFAWSPERLGKARLQVAKRLAEGGFIDTALDAFEYGRGTLNDDALDAVAAYLPADRLDPLIRDSPRHPGLLERRAELGDARGALAVARTLDRGAKRFTAVMRCCAHIEGPLDPDQILEALDDLQLVDSIDQLWACIRVGAPQLARLAAEPRTTACRALFKLLGGRIRLQALPGLYLTGPLLAATGGPEGVAAAFDAVVDAARWWPSYPPARPRRVAQT